MPATLASLRIKNFALVEDLTWQPGAGFNAVSGETGAGKSVLIGALKLLLGERGDRSLIRAGAEQCAVEALFEFPSGDDGAIRAVSAILEEAGAEPCEAGQLIIKRTLSQSAGRQFVNGSPCTIALLKQLGDLLVDLHGPHDHQSLFSRVEQTRRLDDFSGLSELAETYRAARKEWLALLREQEEIAGGSQAAAREIELLRHQVQEIAEACLRPGEEEELLARHRTAANARRIREIGAAATGLLSEGDPCIASLCGDLGRALRELSRIDPGASGIESRQVEINESVADLTRELETYLDGVEIDPEALAAIESRLDMIGSLKRKYGSTVPEIFGFAERAAERLRTLENREERGAGLAEAIAQARSQVEALGKKISAGRKKGAAKLAEAVAGQLAELGFRQAGFSVELVPCPEPSPLGFECADFVFAPNPGEPAKPLRQIASSGEISRVMLALKCALAAQDRVALLVFDEIDANVGGETATKVGAKMRELGSARQVLCITHLPQVAAPAQTHFLVEKHERDGRTVSKLSLLEGQAREHEIARMLGGKSGSALEHARTLLGTRAPAG